MTTFGYQSFHQYFQCVLSAGIGKVDAYVIFNSQLFLRQCHEKNVSPDDAIEEILKNKGGIKDEHSSTNR